MISQKSRYALRALIYLARQGAASIATIAEHENIPRKYLEAIMAELKLHGFVTSRRGKSGGYTLARAASDISFADVLRATDGPLALAPCASRTAYRRCEDCIDVETCSIRHALIAARDATAAVLEATFISDPGADPNPR